MAIFKGGKQNAEGGFCLGVELYFEAGSIVALIVSLIILEVFGPPPNL